MAGRRIARAGLVRIFQAPRVLTRMRVLENLLLAARDQPGERLRHALARAAPGRRGASARCAGRRSMTARDCCGSIISPATIAGTLSGGQRKLLELGRALMAEPRMILLDEPMAGIAPVLAAQLLDHIRALRAERGVTVFLIEHDMDMVMSISDRVIVMDEGRVIADGTARRGAARRAGDRSLSRPVGSKARRHERPRSDASRELHAGYGDEDILRWCFDRGTARQLSSPIIGPNGSGKSTLLKTIYGLVPVRAGQRHAHGRRRHDSIRRYAAEPPSPRSAQHGAADRQRFPRFVGAAKIWRSAQLRSAIGSTRSLPRCSAALPLLRGMLSKRAATLSGGQRQMLAVGRALMSDPRLLILDEPSAGLAPRVQDEVFAMVKDDEWPRRVCPDGRAKGAAVPRDRRIRLRS